jgi:hypothetical protein
MPRSILLVRLVLLVGLVWLSAGCDFQRTVNVDGPEHASRLVVNSELVPGRPWRVDVSRSVGAFRPGNPEDSTFTVTDATVTVLRDGEKLGRLQPDSLDQYSTRQFVPAPGKQYTVRAEAPDRGTATATDRIPRMPPVRLAIGDEGIAHFDLRLTIEDPADTSNYYQIDVRKLRFYRDSSGVEVYERTRYFRTRDPSIVNEMRQVVEDVDEPNVYRGHQATFTDVLFGGTTHSISLRVPDRIPPRDDDGDGYPRVEYVLYVSALSENAYRFSHTRRLFQKTRGNPFAEPVDVHSNVEGGYGIVAGRTTDTLRVEVTPQ